MGATIIQARPPGPPPPPAPARAASQDIWKVERPSKDDPIEQKVAMELRQRFTEWQSADAEFLKNSDYELDFLAGNHWLEEETGVDKKRWMEDNGRSAFTIDLLQPSVDLVVNQMRINKLTATFIPLGGKATKATADVRQGLYRNIDRESKAAIARETAYQFAVSVGRGYERIAIEDEDGPSFNRKISIRRVDNLKSIACDPTVLDFTYADMEWAYAFDDIWKDQFREQYGLDTDYLDTTGMDLPDDNARALWFPKDKVRVGEYFRKKWKRRDAWKLEDGTECWPEDAPPGSHPVKIKSKMDFKIEWRRMTGTQVIEKRVWPSKFIPIVVFIGREVFRGKREKIHSGLVRPAIAPSKINDFMTSRLVDEVALSPLPHFMAMIGQLSLEQKQIVNNINKYPWSVVEQEPKEDTEGRQLPPAQWVSPSPNIGAVVEGQVTAKDSLERVLNTYAPQRGAQVGDQSGRAISAIKDSGDISHAAFPDNYQRALQQEAEIVNDLMDVVYTDKQSITITLPDEKTLQVLINQPYEDPKRPGKILHHQFGGGDKYGVKPSVAPSYLSRSNETVQKILDLAKQFPQMAQVLDLIIGDLDIGPNAVKYQERLRPPGFHDDDDDGPNPVQLQQQLQASQQQLQQADQLIQTLLEKVKELGDKKSIELLKIFSQERIAAGSDRTNLMMAEVKAGNEAAHAVLMAELESVLKALETPPEAAAGDAEPQPADVAASAPQDAGVSPAASPAPPAVPLSTGLAPAPPQQ